MPVPLKKDKKVSVLIPAFNRELYIGDCIKSILKQTYQNFSILVYDDGSTDRTAAIVKEISMQDPRVHLISGKDNKGVAHARNVLLDSCETKIACWQDSDDLANIHRIQEQLRLYDPETCPLILSGYCIFRNGLGIDFTETPPDFAGVTGSARASLLFLVDKAVKFLENKILGGEDIAWFCCMRKKYTVATVPKVLYYVRFHSDRIGWLKWKLKRLTKKDIVGKSYQELSAEYGINAKK